MHVVILGGFLGSGKTTLLLRLVDFIKRFSNKEMPVAILENEIGDIGIDNQLISGKGFEVKTMLSGCACCTLAGELPKAVANIQSEFNPEVLVIEATGLAVPGEMKSNLSRALDIEAWICTLVDASRWRKMLVPLDTLLRQQLTDADIVCVNKTDLVSDDDIDYLNSTLDDFNKSALRVYVAASVGVSDAQAEELLNWHGCQI